MTERTDRQPAGSDRQGESPDRRTAGPDRRGESSDRATGGPDRRTAATDRPRTASDTWPAPVCDRCGGHVEGTQTVVEDHREAVVRIRTLCPECYGGFLRSDDRAGAGIEVFKAGDERRVVVDRAAAGMVVADDRLVAGNPAGPTRPPGGD